MEFFFSKRMFSKVIDSNSSHGLRGFHRSKFQPKGKDKAIRFLCVSVSLCLCGERFSDPVNPCKSVAKFTIYSPSDYLGLNNRKTLCLSCARTIPPSPGVSATAARQSGAP